MENNTDIGEMFLREMTPEMSVAVDCHMKSGKDIHLGTFSFKGTEGNLKALQTALEGLVREIDKEE